MNTPDNFNRKENSSGTNCQSKIGLSQLSIVNYQLVNKQLLADLHTPVSIYLKVRDLFPESALLESSDFHGNENSLSYIALCPVARIGINHGTCSLLYPDGQKEVKPLSEEYTVADAMNAFLSSFSVRGENKEVCGLFGYTAFDAVRYFEPVPVMEAHHDENDAPDMLYILYKYILVFNHFKNELTLIEMLQEGETSRIEEIETWIENRNFASYNYQSVGEEHSPVTDDEYKAMVRQGIRHCLRGDVFQIVLSRRFEQAFKGDDFKVYRALRNINPSPYLFYFDFGGFRIFGSSPETHCKIKENHANIDPIAGTAFRSGNTLVDRQRTEALLADPKENAEHVMLVDLARNDLSRNAHNVTVEFYKEVQYYSHVIHLVSRVGGEINPDSNPIQTYIDTFPAGTLSGAPKVRAMQLITEIEKHNRGAYGGCIGFIGFNGDLNQAITIRSFVSRDNVLYYQAGAGIVAQSNDERELQEVNNKLGALKKAIVLAEQLIN
ncbi:anthranilate synthase component I family protein [Parabacteroides sp. PF5-6]|uniref:anthranilate synthase component I family protein n=1 Tax=Parabacteroides sp. PF5-6 TaxID=1742403 RepID=UPI0024075C91|nr:anthranilate synthase component I family protein [Parabacteroides sp. PF5-6]MDF9828980.1 anthranilate synthase component 1 [Parabacteroides sp. PF5-6]